MNRSELLALIDQEGDRHEWEYKSYKCEITRNTLKAWCGYVYLPTDHDYYGMEDSSINISVHGGITYTCWKEGFWVIGFDCSHSGDTVIYDEIMQNTFSDGGYDPYGFGTSYRDKQFVISECESMVDQLCDKSLSYRRSIKLDKILKIE
jgi:hypothetical protein